MIYGTNLILVSLSSMRLQLMQSLASRFYTAPQSGSSCLVLWQIPGGSRADDDLCVAVIARLQHVRLSRLWIEQKADVLCCEGNNGRPPRRAI